MAAKVDPGVVDIDALIAYSGGTSSEGTGMVISRDGLVLTNNHVINGSNSIHVRAAVASGSREYTATVVGYDATHDVALLKINAPNLQPVSVGNSDQVKLGTPVVALGNAEGQGGLPRAAAGLVNSLNKTIDPPTRAPARPRPCTTCCRPRRTSFPATPAARWPTGRARSSA